MDSILSLALSLQSNKGVYALMLGSGISRAASIPTGWEIVEDLVRKIAHLSGAECGGDAIGWYLKAFGKQPNYSDILAQVAPEPTERKELLRGYFEPTPEEKEQGLKIPTKAHKEIAWLVSKGYVRVVLTTNFDRLMETAIEAEGIVPTVISSPDAIAGAMPLVHTPCCVIKVHGDYMDSRIRNTPGELSTYDSRIDAVLDRVFDDFGLIVCGWSAEWDIALRAVLERCVNRRFTTFWAAQGAVTPAAEKLIAHRRAKVLPIIGADRFFHELREKVESLEQIAGPHPMSAKVAAATVKRYLVDERHRIELYDLATLEAERLLQQLPPSRFPVQWGFSTEELVGRLRRYEAQTEILQSIIMVGCFWGGKEELYLWTRILDRISNFYQPVASTTLWINLRLYPALLVLYSGGIAAIAAESYDIFASLLTAPKIRQGSREHQLVERVNAVRVADRDAMRQIPALKNHSTPTSQYLFELLREPLREFLPDDTAYERCFDKFEYLLALVYMDLVNNAWAPLGLFAIRDFAYPEIRVAIELKDEFEAAGEDWPPIRSGLFGGSVSRFREVQVSFEAFLKRALL